MKLPITIAAALASLVIAGSCLADTKELARAGAWKAFGGTSNDGTRVCGMSSSGSGKFFSVKYYAGDDTLTIQLGNDQRTLKDKAKVKTVMRIDKEAPWNATATGMHFSDGDAGLEFDINSKQIEEFIREFHDGNKISVTFPDDEVSSWLFTLDGSDTIVVKFAGCLKDMK